MKSCVQIAVAVAAAVVLSGAEPSLGADSKSSVAAIRHELLRLPYYGVFDFLAFRLSVRRFPGMEPLGDYPLHIIVKRGTITLLGVLDSEADKTVAGLRAREVPGSFGVENELVVETAPPR